MTRRLHSLLQHDSEHVGRVVRTQISLVQRRLNGLRSLHLTFQANGQTGAVDASKLWTDNGARAHVTRHVLSLTHLPTVLNLLRALSIEFNLSRLDVLSSVGRRLRKKETATAAPKKSEKILHRRRGECFIFVNQSGHRNACINSQGRSRIQKPGKCRHRKVSER